MKKYQNFSKRKRGGARPGAGRPKGKPNIATRRLKDLLSETDPLAIRRLKTFMRSRDPLIAIAAIKLVWSYRFGRPPSYLDLAHSEPETNGEVIMIEAGGTEEEYTEAMRRARREGCTPVLRIGGSEENYIRGLRRLRGELYEEQTE